ncbi:MAG: hypothetical protein EA380_02940 [Phycisphaeraceae bacterium]|nr:MAG: hypothetical protein EA380_02940 [Phycisphaeraceae bacterium]
MTESMTRLMRGVMTMGVCVALSGAGVWAGDKPAAEHTLEPAPETAPQPDADAVDLLITSHRITPRFIVGFSTSSGFMDPVLVEARAAWNADVSPLMSEFLQALSETEWSRIGDASVPQTDGPRQGANTEIYVHVPLIGDMDTWVYFLSDRYVRPHFVYTSDYEEWRFEHAVREDSRQFAKYMLVRDMTPRFDPRVVRSGIYRVLQSHWEVCGVEPMTISLHLLQRRMDEVVMLRMQNDRAILFLTRLTGNREADGSFSRMTGVPVRVVEDIIRDTLTTCGIYATLGMMHGTETSLMEQAGNIELARAMAIPGAYSERLRAASEERKELRGYTDLLDLAIEIGERCEAWESRYGQRVRMAVSGR